MTIVEIEDTLPNGLHDAEIEDIFVDFANKEARFGSDVWVGDLDSPSVEGREATRRGTLVISNLFFFITIPDDNYNALYGGGIAGAYSKRPEELPVKVVNRIPDTVFINVLYTGNSAMYIAAEDAKFEWAQ